MIEIACRKICCFGHFFGIFYYLSLFLFTVGESARMGRLTLKPALNGPSYLTDDCKSTKQDGRRLTGNSPAMETRLLTRPLRKGSKILSYK